MQWREKRGGAEQRNKWEMGDTSVGGREAPRKRAGEEDTTVAGGAGPKRAQKRNPTRKRRVGVCSTLERSVPTNARADGGRSRTLLRPPEGGKTSRLVAVRQRWRRGLRGAGCTVGMGRAGGMRVLEPWQRRSVHLG